MHRLAGKLSKYTKELNPRSITLLLAGPTTCKLTPIGKEYEGTLNVTDTGIPCQAWTADSPQDPETLYDYEFPDGSLAAAENYCRNPDTTTGGPWCYTMDPSVRWQFCDVYFCRKYYNEVTFSVYDMQTETYSGIHI